MCSISINATVDDQLADLQRAGEKRKNFEKRLFREANEASIEKPGALDDLSNHMKGMPDDLRDIRKKQIGRHRVYYIGDHRQCSFHAVYIKLNKKDDVDRENDIAFQKRLTNLIGEPATRTLQDPDKPTKQ